METDHAVVKLPSPESCQRIHEARQHAENTSDWPDDRPPHDLSDCWCCCLTCNWPAEEIFAAAGIT